eukprot:PLAT8229.1.p2 GENE.PLAT8229.1~~PLAT8229.1.p2  ORF type:complete len:463 (-),score=173.34 PLAT8229.1:57-1397(-)
MVERKTMEEDLRSDVERFRKKLADIRERLPTDADIEAARAEIETKLVAVRAVFQEAATRLRAAKTSGDADEVTKCRAERDAAWSQVQELTNERETNRQRKEDYASALESLQAALEGDFSRPAAFARDERDAILLEMKTLLEGITEFSRGRQVLTAELERLGMLKSAIASCGAVMPEPLREEIAAAGIVVDGSLTALASDVGSRMMGKLRGRFARFAAPSSASAAAGGAAAAEKPPVFRGRLDEMHCVAGVPPVVVSCVDFLRRYALKQVGVFRVPGQLDTVQWLQRQFEDGYAGAIVPVADPATEEDIAAVATLLKQFFRELKDPVFPHAYYDRMIDIVKGAGEGEDRAVVVTEDMRTALIALLSELPRVNRLCLLLLLELMSEIAAHSDVNLMSAPNVAVATAPSLLSPPPDADAMTVMATMKDVLAAVQVCIVELPALADTLIA